MKYRIVKKKIDHSYLLKLLINSYVDWLIAESKHTDENAIKIFLDLKNIIGA